MSLRIGRREFSTGLVAGVVGGLGVTAALISAVVVLATRPHAERQRVPEVTAAVDQHLSWVSPDDLLVEDELERGTTPRWVPYRPPRERWIEADRDRYWISPQEIGIDVLEARVNAEIRSMLEDVR